MEIVPSNILVVPHRDVVTNEKNPRYILDADLKKLIQSLIDFPEMLYKRPLVCVSCDDVDGKYRPLGGNMRLEAIPLAITQIRDELPVTAWEKKQKLEKALQILEKGIPIMLADEWSEEQRNEFVIKDNVGYGQWDWEALANSDDYTFEQLADWGMKIPDINVTVIEDTVEDDFDQTPAKVAKSLDGDLYELNGHRIICGDTTDLGAVARLMNGVEANLCFTSPPYWVGKDYETQKSENEINEFIQRTTACIVLATSKDNGRVVINTGTSSIHRIEKGRRVEILPLIDKWQAALRYHGWLLRHLRIWAKRGQLPASISPKTDTIDQHNEYLGLFEANDEYSQVTTYWAGEGMQRGQERIGTKWAQQGVWDDLPEWAHKSLWNDIHGEKSAGGRHTAAFPVELPARNIRLYTKPDEIVYEAFGGSGTTLIAAEQLSRRCYLIELSPNYVDTVVKRWVAWMEANGKDYSVKRNGKDISTDAWLKEEEVA